VVSVGLTVPGAAPADDVGTVDVGDNTIVGAPDVVDVVELVGRTMCVRTTLGSPSVCVPDPLPDLGMVSDSVVVVTDTDAFADPPAPVSPEAPDC
jgi:hypothetical protein